MPSYEERRGVLEFMPMECEASTSACPEGGCCAAPGDWAECTPEAGNVSPGSWVCDSYHNPCFHTRNAATFRKYVSNINHVWRPSNGCYFSPLTVSTPSQFREWAVRIEAAVGPTLFVGDTLLAEAFLAFQHLTGAAHSEFQFTNTLTNTYTLAPMTPDQVDRCLTPGAAGALPATADAITPCPPTTASPYYYEDNAHHRIHHMRWTKPLTIGAARYRTLVLGTGAHLWHQHAYSAHTSACRTAGGVADAYKPLRSLGLGDYGCEVFAERYPIIVGNVARFLASTDFNGHVVFVTTPLGARGCDAISSPNTWQAAAGGTSSLGKEAGAEYYYEQLRHAEIVWRSAFQKWAPRLKLTVLNVTHISETRADARTPGDCEHFCYPGLPHLWAEMLLRLLEQHHYRL